MKRVVVAEPAARDLDDIIAFIALDDRRAAEAVYRAIVATTGRLAEFPDIGRAGRLPGTREFPVTNLPYVIVYAVGAEAVTILAVFHAARDLARALTERRAALKRRGRTPRRGRGRSDVQ
ncbi:MAG: type II toxin-antitoxin system RelE/ParE family toxin [Proteobacteria bacterium]|nr:type II toxin-antitoxin system RelE/ParE family toxin [Pseudomonadota bacterium]